MKIGDVFTGIASQLGLVRPAAVPETRWYEYIPGTALGIPMTVCGLWFLAHGTGLCAPEQKIVTETTQAISNDKEHEVEEADEDGFQRVSPQRQWAKVISERWERMAPDSSTQRFQLSVGAVLTALGGYILHQTWR